MEEKIVMLDESDLDSVVGGAYNQKAIAKLGLETRIGASGAVGLYVEMKCSSGQLPGDYRGIDSKGWTSDGRVRSAVESHDNVSVSAMTTSGEMKTLTKKELNALLS